MSTIAYLRVSTDKQDEASQRQIISEWCAKSGLTVSAWEADTASGATPWQQRRLGTALDVRDKGDTILVSEISRIARSTIGVLTFLQACADKGVSVIAIKSGITLDGSTASKIVVTVLAMAAEIERDLLRERTRAALQSRKASGLPIGRQVGAVGKRSKLDDRKEEIAKLLAADVSKSAIARLCGVARGTLDSFLEKQKEVSDVPNS